MLQPRELAHWLIRFVLELRRKDGTEYLPRTIHHLCVGIMCFLCWHGFSSIDYFKAAELAEFRATLDGEMKRLQEQGVRSKSKQAEPLTEDEKEILWEKALLGDITPQTLLDTIIFMNSLYFVLRSESEHWALKISPPQIEVVERRGAFILGVHRRYLNKTALEDLTAKTLRQRLFDTTQM